MDLHPTTAAIIATIGGALSAGGLASKLIDWLSNRTASKTTIDAKTIDAELTVNERLLVRIRELEQRLDEVHDELRMRETRTDEVVTDRDRLAKREVELLAQTGRLAREAETLRTDHAKLREHATRLERENKKLRDGTARTRR